MRYPIIIQPDEQLRKPNQEIQELTDELVYLLDDMYETMLAHDGVGIAAPQIGKNLQMAVVEVDENDRFDLINPQIIDRKGKSVFVEGCLSIPHVFGTVERAEEITVRYYDREGDEMEVTAYGYLARAIQHEIDHLNGVLFTDKVLEAIPEEELENYYEEHEHD
ncbi:peptide deformylase [Enterococcus italicus]|jgi:peptide deformylase|uniref:Peptide deformylase n=1 Tax=Enterococcus italicus (strain DSM 15952 / CCUG 50447 / LMG 22039 / TP 1.5) TaxID=888064 RepID=E6LED9_ENTI1|nr:peptide deformylase [Enterococcus italicus]EFU74428.1 peptide deformylase [Enterococcus italicus DSM 15952]OJG61132.1 peptide deformylase [Enterococcus italicus DSM 15952]HCS29832.1 peptide deformylase [Enterococcus sp.]